MVDDDNGATGVSSLRTITRLRDNGFDFRAASDGDADDMLLLMLCEGVGAKRRATGRARVKCLIKKLEYVMFAAIKRVFLFESSGASDDNSVVLPAQVWRALNSRFAYPVDPKMPFKSDNDVVITLLQVAPDLPLYDDMADLNFMHAVVFIDDPELLANKADSLYAKKIEALESATLQSLSLQFSANNTESVGEAIVFYRFGSVAAPSKRMYVVLYCLETHSCSTFPVPMQLCAGKCRAVLIAALTDAYSAVGVTFEYKRRFIFTGDTNPVHVANVADAEVHVVGIFTYKHAAANSPDGTHIISIHPAYDFASWWPVQVPLSVISRRYLHTAARPTDQLTDPAVFRKWLEHGHYSSVTLLLKFKALAARWPAVKTFTNLEANNAIRDYVANYKDEQRTPSVGEVVTISTTTTTTTSTTSTTTPPTAAATSMLTSVATL